MVEQAGGTGAAIGRLGEDAALGQYTRAGYALVARNWRCRLGEIDLVLARGGTLVVCEVKTRRGGGYGAPFEAVDHRKRGKLRVLAEAFLVSESAAPAVAMITEVRFDVASVTISGRGARVHVFEDAF
jgi:putative endonuclease